MLRITRFVKKEKLFELINDSNISKFELHTSLNKRLRDETVVKVNIYLRIPKNEFLSFLSTYKDKASKQGDNMVFITLNMAHEDYFLKESAFDDFGIGYDPSKTMKLFIEKYNQQYFWDL